MSNRIKKKSVRQSLDKLRRKNRRSAAWKSGLLLEQLEDRRLLAVVATDLADYAPADTALISATGYQPGETVEFQVLHIDGTPNTGNGHDPWFVTDGSPEDLDGLVDGNVDTSWFVDPDDSLGATFELTASGQSSGLVATTFFTDAGGDYSIDFSAADPDLYASLLPGQVAVPTGRANDPITNAADDTSVESLAPSSLALGQIVPFKFRISVDGGSPANDSITFVAGFETETNNGGAFGYDASLGVLAAFVDEGDPNHSESGTGTDATVDNFSWMLVGTEIQGTIEVAGLDPNEEVIVEVWLVLQDSIMAGTTSNVQSRLIDADTSGTVESGQNISTGNQTIPLLKVQDFFSADADLSVTKSDVAMEPVAIGDTFDYTIVVTNNSTDVVANSVIATDTLDADTIFVSSSVNDTQGFVTTVSHDGAPTGGVVTADLGFLNPGEAVTITLTVQVGNVTNPTGGVFEGNCNGAEDLCNTVMVTSITDDPNTSNNSDDEPTGVAGNPAYTIVKTVTDVGGDGPGGMVDAAADVITYQIVVTNTGDQSITGVSLADPLLQGANGTLSGETESLTNDDILEVGETWTYTGTYTAQQSDIDDNGGGDGDIDNTATVSSNELPNESDSEDVPIAQNPAYTIVKTVTDVGGDGAGGMVDAAGDLITYQIVVTNSGNQSITGVSLADPLLQGANGTLSGETESMANDDILEVGETWTYTGTYTAQQSDIDDNGGGDGDIDNTATVSSDQLPNESDSEDVPIAQNPTYTIVKTVTDVGGDGAGAMVDAAGDLITYQIVVTNTGNQSITGVSLADPLLQGANGTLSGETESMTNDDILEVGETWTYTGTYTTQQSDIDDNGGGDGDIDNTATVSSDQLPNESDSEDVPIAQNPTYTIVKTVTDVGGDGAGGLVDAAGDLITYQIVVTNTGNQSLTGVSLADPLLQGANGTLSGETESMTNDDILEVGETWTYTGTYTAQQSDIDDNGGGDGDIDNTATVSSNELPDESDSEDVPIAQAAGYAINKTVTDVGGDGAGGTVDAANDVITYQIVVTNTGNQSITGVSLADPLLQGANGTLSGETESMTNDDILEVGETWTYTGTYTAQQSDIDDNGGGDGDIDNTATVSSNELPDESDSEDVPIAQNPAYTIVKTVTDVGGDGAGGTVDAANDLITYQIVVTNTGNQSITGVSLADPLLQGANGTLSGETESMTNDDILEVGETWTYTGTYTAQQSDIDDNGGGDGDIDNTATVSSNELPNESDSEDVPIAQNAAYTIVKTVTDVGGDGAGGMVDAAGDLITYQIVVTNTGNQSITGVGLADPLLQGANGTLSGETESMTNDDILEVGETWTYTGTYTAQQSDIDDNGGGDGDIDNTATVSSNELPNESDSEDVPIAQNAAYTIVKTVTDVGGDGLAEAWMRPTT